MMKKIAVIAALCVCVLPLCACREAEVREEQTARLAVATFYPVYSLAAPLLKGVPDMEIRCLTQPQDGCIRDYALSEWDVSLLSLSDVVVLGGRGLERFESAILELGEGGPVVISAMSGLTLIDEDKAAVEADENAHTGPNPWLFLSVDGAAEMVTQIAASFAYIDAEYQAVYTQNAEAMINKLVGLKAEMEALIEGGRETPVALLCEGLAYFARDFSLNVVFELPREPISDLSPNEFSALTAALSDRGASIVLIEKQASTRLKKDLEDAGFIVCAIDTLTAHMADGDEDGYQKAMYRNAVALSEAYKRSN